MSDQPSVSFNRNSGPYDLNVLANTIKKDILLGLNCHTIATVREFNYASQTVTAQIVYNQTYFKKDQDGTYKKVFLPYPTLLDVPVIILGGGDARLTFPIRAGDQCLILFNDRDIDNWLAGSTTGEVASSRLHSISDGIALIGLNNGVTNYDTARAVLRNGTASVGVGTELIKIANDITTLKTVLDGLIDTLTTVLGSGTAGGDPVVFSAIASLNAYKAQIAELLE